MVHALREIWRVLKPDSTLIDFRPLHTDWRMDIVNSHSRKLVEDGLSDESRISRDDSAERALVQAQSEGWLKRISASHIEYPRGWFSVDELAEYWAEKSPPQYFRTETLARAQVMLEAAGPDAMVRVVNPIEIGIFRKTGRAS